MQVHQPITERLPAVIGDLASRVKLLEHKVAIAQGNSTTVITDVVSHSATAVNAYEQLTNGLVFDPFTATPGQLYRITGLCTGINDGTPTAFYVAWGSAFGTSTISNVAIAGSQVPNPFSCLIEGWCQFKTPTSVTVMLRASFSTQGTASTTANTMSAVSVTSGVTVDTTVSQPLFLSGAVLATSGSSVIKCWNNICEVVGP